MHLFRLLAGGLRLHPFSFLPIGIGIKLLHGFGEDHGFFAEIPLIHDPIAADDESHYAGGAILGNAYRTAALRTPRRIRLRACSSFGSRGSHHISQLGKAPQVGIQPVRKGTPKLAYGHAILTAAAVGRIRVKC
jgi:hypothetical protein